MSDTERPDLALLERAYRGTLDRGLLFTRQALVLATVIRDPGRSTGDIAAHLGMGRVAVTRSIAALVEDGLVVNRIDPQDNRLRIVEPTTEGRTRLDAIAAAAFHPENHDQ